MQMSLTPKALALFTGLLLVLTTTPGCERSPAPGSSQGATGTATGESSGGGKPVLTFISGASHHYLDPQKISWLHDIRIADMLFTPLLRWQVIPKLKLEPAAAASWDISADNLTYTFHLRTDGKWSNGDPVTAGDFIYAWRRAILPDTAADYSQLFFCIQGAEPFFKWRVEQINDIAQGKLTAAEAWTDAQARFDKTVALHAPDDHTLVVTLKQPTPYFLQLCAFVTFDPVHKASLSKLQTLNAHTGMLEMSATASNYWSDPKQLISNGPYVLARRRFKRDLLVLPNPMYFDKSNVANGGWLETINDNPQTELIAFRQNKVDWLPDLPTASPLAADLIAENLPTVHTLPSAGTYFYSFNCEPTLSSGKKNPLADPRVRRALSLGIDRKTIVDRVSRMGQPIARTFIPPNIIQGYNPPVDQGPTYNVPEAKRLLAEAGYPDGKGLTGLSILYNTGAGHENPAQQIKHAWEQDLGVVVELQGVESKRFGQLLKNHEYTIARASWFGDYRDPSTFLDKYMTDGGNNDAAWSNPTYDQLLSAADTQTNPAKRMALYEKAEALLLHEAPIAPIFQYIDLYMYDANHLHGLKPNAWKFRRLDLVSKTK